MSVFIGVQGMCVPVHAYVCVCVYVCAHTLHQKETSDHIDSTTGPKIMKQVLVRFHAQTQDLYGKLWTKPSVEFVLKNFL